MTAYLPKRRRKATKDTSPVIGSPDADKTGGTSKQADTPHERRRTSREQRGLTSEQLAAIIKSRSNGQPTLEEVLARLETVSENGKRERAELKGQLSRFLKVAVGAIALFLTPEMVNALSLFIIRLLNRGGE